MVVIAGHRGDKIGLIKNKYDHFPPSPFLPCSDNLKPDGMPMQRRVFSALLGGVAGAIIGTPLCAILAIALTQVQNISTIDGASGYAAVYYFLFSLPVVIVFFIVLNTLKSNGGWPVQLLKIEAVLSLLSLLIIGLAASFKW